MAQAKCVFSYLIEVASGERCVEHGHDCCELVYNLGCEGVLRQGAHEYAYRDGSVFVYQPGDTHWIENRKAGRQVCIGVAGAGVEELPPGIWNETAPSIPYFEEVLACLESFKWPSLLVREKLDFLCGLIVIELRLTVPAVTWGPRDHARRARAIIESSLHEPLDVSVLARRTFISPDHLRHLFKEEFGESITSYVIRRRIEAAAQLLRGSDLPVHRVAAECGFQNQYYFSRLFRKVIGCTASEYRRGG